MASCRVLIIDDDAACRRVFFRLADKLGYESVSASSGREGLALARQRSPDVLLLDLRLRDMTGFEVLKALRQDPATESLPVIVITGESEAADLLSSAAAGFGVSAYLQKPVALAVLAAALKRAVGEPAPAAAGAWAIERDPLTIDLRRRLVLVAGKPLRLGPRRYETLCALARSKDGLTGKMLRDLVWGLPDEPLNTVAKTVHRLRRDLAAAAGRDLIVPIPGGYKLQ